MSMYFSFFPFKVFLGTIHWFVCDGSMSCIGKLYVPGKVLVVVYCCISFYWDQ